MCSASDSAELNITYSLFLVLLVVLVQIHDSAMEVSHLRHLIRLLEEVVAVTQCERTAVSLNY